MKSFGFCFQVSLNQNTIWNIISALMLLLLNHGMLEALLPLLLVHLQRLRLAASPALSTLLHGLLQVTSRDRLDSSRRGRGEVCPGSQDGKCS